MLNGTSGGELQGMQKTVKHAEVRGGREKESIGSQKHGTERDRNSEKGRKNIRNVGIQARTIET